MPSQHRLCAEFTDFSINLLLHCKGALSEEFMLELTFLFLKLCHATRNGNYHQGTLRRDRWDPDGCLCLPKHLLGKPDGRTGIDVRYRDPLIRPHSGDEPSDRLV